MCLPNEHFTELLEFCYTVPFLTIEEGKYTCIKSRQNILEDDVYSEW